MEKELIVVKGKVIEQEKGYHAGVGKHIGYEAGAKMIKRHFDENPDDVMAHFIGRDIIDKILAQPGCIGIRTFNGLNEIGIKQVILVGVDKNGNNILEVDIINHNGQVFKNQGVIVSSGRICPPYCGGTTEIPTTTTTTSNWF
jgi:hypothetical protein